MTAEKHNFLQVKELFEYDAKAQQMVRSKTDDVMHYISVLPVKEYNLLVGVFLTFHVFLITEDSMYAVSRTDETVTSLEVKHIFALFEKCEGLDVNGCVSCAKGTIYCRTQVVEVPDVNSASTFIKDFLAGKYLDARGNLLV